MRLTSHPATTSQLPNTKKARGRILRCGIKFSTLIILRLYSLLLLRSKGIELSFRKELLTGPGYMKKFSFFFPLNVSRE